MERTISRRNLKKVILTPISAGTITIPSYRVQANLQGQDFFSRGKTIYLDTEEKTVDVKQLPTANRPKDFSGLVGKPTINTQFSQDEVNYEESITLQINLSGNCNMDILDSIYPKDRDDVTIYETSEELKEGINGSAYYAEKSFEVIIIPQKTGKIVLEPVVISYFDVETATYEELMIAGKTITVNGDMKLSGEKGNIGNTNSNDKQRTVINQIQPTETSGDYFIIKKSYVYVLLILIVVVLIILFYIFIIIRKSKERVDQQLRALYQRAKKAKDNHMRYELLNEMIKYRYHVSLKTTSRSELKNYIDDNGVLEDILSIIDIMESGYQSGQIKEESIADLISKVYKQIKKGVRLDKLTNIKM